MWVLLDYYCNGTFLPCGKKTHIMCTIYLEATVMERYHTE